MWGSLLIVFIVVFFFLLRWLFIKRKFYIDEIILLNNKILNLESTVTKLEANNKGLNENLITKEEELENVESGFKYLNSKIIKQKEYLHLILSKLPSEKMDEITKTIEITQLIDGGDKL